MKPSAMDFIHGLREVLPDQFPDGSRYGGAWTTWMFSQLHELSKQLGLGCCCTFGGHSKEFQRARKQDGLHREYLFDMTWYDEWGAWTQPDVIIEHENLWSKDAFLFDQWKLMVGFAPLRVGIGYARREANLGSLVEGLEDAQSRGKWVFPEETEDLVLLGHGGMAAPDAFVVLHRPRRGASFQRLGTLRTALI